MKQLWRGVCFCGDCAASLLCWTLWLALAGLAAVQIGVAFSHELAVPQFALRALEQRLTASDLLPRFGRATFDPTGRVLLENVQLSLREFAEPIAHVRAVYVELDPWPLFLGRFEAQRVQATGIKLFAPAMLTPTGRSEEMLSDLDLAVSPGDEQVVLEHLAARLAGIAVTARGGIQIDPVAAAPESPLPLLAAFATRFADYSRRLIQASEKVAALEEPAAEITLTPSSTRGAIAGVTLTARNLRLPELHELTATDVRATTRVPLTGGGPSITPIAVEAAEVRVRGGVTLHDVHARVRGALRPQPWSYAPRELEFTASRLTGAGLTLRSLAARAEPGALPDFQGNLLGELEGSPIALNGEARFRERSARVHFAGALSPTLIAPVGALLGHDLRRFIGFGAPVDLDVEATFLPGWKFERLSGRVAARQIDAYRVPMDSVRGRIEFDGRRFVARDAVAVLGENEAHGSFEQDLVSREFRFLLDGRLRPLAIGGWFREWWPGFFNNFEFPLAPPNASVDVRGRWGVGHETTVFVFAESMSPLVRGAQLDYARTLIFIRPNFLDGLEVFGTRGAGEVRGAFTRHIELPGYRWREMNIALTSTLDLQTGAKLLGPDLGARLQPFVFESPPRVSVAARFDGPGSAAGPRQNMRIEAQSTGAFSFHDFPARNLAFDAVLRDDELTLERVEASVADGTLSGNAKLWGPEGGRRLGFDASLRGASLGLAVTTVSQYAARRRGSESAGAEKILPGKNNVRLDLALSAEGGFDDPFSYRGNGNAALEGAGLGEVRLLGLLSALLDFTALRFTSARAEFKVEGPTIVFPSVNVTGANAAIHAHGDYSLRERQLSFNARIYPFEESNSLLQSVVGAVLTPLSTVLEVKLTGALDDPKWAFVIGPTNLLRSLTQPAAAGNAAVPGAGSAPSPSATSAAGEKTH